MQPQKVACGIDVSSTHLEVCVLQPKGDPIRYTAKNSVHGIRRLIPWLRAQGVKRVVMEATGGYEQEARDKFRKAGFQVSIANPVRVRNYARGVGTLAKTDRIDAEMIAQFAGAKRKKNRKKREVHPNEVKLIGLVKRRRQLQDIV